MKTITNFFTTLVPLPYYKSNKLDSINENIQQQIVQETRDLQRITGNTTLLKPQKSVFSFYESSLNKLYTKLHFIKAKYDTLAEDFIQLKYQYINWVICKEKAVDFESKLVTPKDSVNPISAIEINKNKSERSITYTGINENPTYVNLELQTYQSQRKYALEYAKENFSEEKPEEKVTLSYYTSSLLETPVFPMTLLGSISLGKILLTWFIYIAGITSEAFIYQHVIGSLFQMEIWYEEVLIGFVAVLLSKIVGSLLHGSLLEFLQNNSRVFQIFSVKINRVYLFLLIITLLYTSALGSVYYTINQQNKASTEYVMLQESQMNIQNNLDTGTINQEEAKQQLSEIESRKKIVAKKLEEEDSILDKLTIIISSLLILLNSATLFEMASIYTICYKLRVKMDKKAYKISLLSASFYSTKDTIITVRNKAFRIICLHAEILFINRIRFATPKDVLYNNNPKIYPLYNEKNEFSN